MVLFYEYFSRQMVLPKVGVSGQKKLQATKCLVIGARGLGSATLYYLSAAGIGTLGICDSDHLDMTNRL
jgi:molybdopterin/thiamine biosynthesis adenylyltransferase